MDHIMIEYVHWKVSGMNPLTAARSNMGKKRINNDLLSRVVADKVPLNT